MSQEGTLPNPLDLIINKYNYDPYLWGYTFVEGAIRKASESEEQGFPPEFTKSIFNEAYKLVEDSQVVDQFPNTNPFLRLRRESRITPQDCKDITLMSDFQIAEFAKFYSGHAQKKLLALSEYLVHEGYVEAVPLSFLAGIADRMFMEDDFQEVDAEDYEAESRNAVHMRAWKIFKQGGTMYLPYWDEKQKPPFVVHLGPQGAVKSSEFANGNYTNLNNRTKYHLQYEGANGVVLGMFKKPFTRTE